MRQKAVATIVGAIGVFVGGAAAAAEGQWYVSGEIGVRAVEREEALAPGVALDMELGNGLFAAAAAGRYFGAVGPALRLEGEVAWRGGKLNRLDVNGEAVAVVGDGLSALSVMTNAYLDFHNKSRVTPFIGAGVGVSKLYGDLATGANVINDSATAFSLQAIAGVDVALTSSASLFTDFRYFRTEGAEMRLTGDAGAGTVEIDYDAFTVGAGVRVRF